MSRDFFYFFKKKNIEQTKKARFCSLMDKEYLHRVDLDLLCNETGMTLDEISEMVGISQSRNLGKWKQEKSKGGCRPTYDALALLMARGATTKSLFGFNASNVPKSETEAKITQSEIEEGVRKVLSDMMGLTAWKHKDYKK